MMNELPPDINIQVADEIRTLIAKGEWPTDTKAINDKIVQNFPIFFASVSRLPQILLVNVSLLKPLEITNIQIMMPYELQFSQILLAMSVHLGSVMS